MSFSSEVKKQLAEADTEKTCCGRAQSFSMLLYSGILKNQGAKYISLHRCAAQSLAQCLASSCGASVEIREYNAREQQKKRFEVSLPNEAERELLRCGLRDEHGKLNSSLITGECCLRAFFRGAFIVCGSVTDPQKGYDLEFDAPDEESAKLLVKLIKTKKLSCGMSERKNSFAVYIKELDSVQNILGYMGADGALFTMADVSIERDLRNVTNRRVNCDSANIKKQTEAAMLQREAILKLCGEKGIEKLPEELREVALLRLENPEMSLRELAESMEEPISHSAVNRRLNRLIELSGLGGEKKK